MPGCWEEQVHASTSCFFDLQSDLSLCLWPLFIGSFRDRPAETSRTVEGPDQVLVESLILLTDQARAGRRGDPMVASSFAHGEWHEAIPSSTLGCRIHWPWGSQGAVARRVELQDPQRGSVDQLRHLRSPVWGTAWSSAGFAGLHGELYTVYRIRRVYQSRVYNIGYKKGHLKSETFSATR